MNELIASKEVKISESAIRYPVMVDYERGTVMYLSKKERLVCNVLLETNFSLSEACKQIKAITGRQIAMKTIEYWLDHKAHVLDHLKKEVVHTACANVSKAEYKAKLVEWGKSERPIPNSTIKSWEIFGKVMGYVDADQSLTVQNNQVLNFTQADGSK